MRRARWFLILSGTLIVRGASAQSPDIDLAMRLAQDASVRAALQAARDDEPLTIADQIRICEVAAPPFREGERARLLADAFRAVGLRNVRTDREGNVLAERPGQAPSPNIV